VSIPFHVALVRPAWRTAHPLLGALEAALHSAAQTLLARLVPPAG